MEMRPDQTIMVGSEQFAMGSQRSPVQAPAPTQTMRLAFTPDGTAIYKPVTNSSPAYQGAGAGGTAVSGKESIPPALAAQPALNIGMGETPIKKKRGRPRKYGPDGTIALALASSSPPGTAAGSAGLTYRGVDTMGNAAASSPVKKVRGRPPGPSKKRQMAALGLPCVGFTPHVLTVKAGEDVASKIMTFCQHGSRAVCVLSATGVISNVSLRQPAMSGGTVTYEGRFEILSLSGSFLLTESDGQRSRTGGLSVSLAGTDGRVWGGGVAGLLTAASPVQIVVGTFTVDSRKETTPASPPEVSPFQSKLTPGASMGPSSPPSRGLLLESSGGPASPPNQISAACNNGNQPAMANK